MIANASYLLPSAVLHRYEAMCAAADDVNRLIPLPTRAWRGIRDRLLDASSWVEGEMRAKLLDRARDCEQRAVRFGLGNAMPRWRVRVEWRVAS